MFSLSLLTLFVVWPLYSLIQEYLTNQTLTYTFLTENQALLITFIIILTFSFHLLVHNTFFEGSLPKIRRHLRLDLSGREINEAVEAITDE